MLDSKRKEIISNLDAVQAEIKRFSGSSFLPVTKKTNVESISVAIDWGVRKFGENYIQETIPKIDKIRQLYPEKNIEWYFIGVLQSNKVKKAVKYFDVIETVSREKIFCKIVRYASIFDKPMKILIEVNPSAEESKSGLLYGEIEPFLEEIEADSPDTYQPVTIEGFMTLGNPYLNEKEKRMEFRSFVSRMRSLREKHPVIGEKLSFGMSSDYKIALEEGSTEVRLGTALFGPRE